MEIFDRGCLICGDNSGVLHSHHTVPRSRGGEHSLQIPLCGTCHTQLHAHALFIVSKINNPKRNKKQPIRKFWRSPEDEARAEKYLQILVQALILPIPDGLERKHLVSFNASTVLFEQIKLLQLDLGFSSLEKTFEFCIQNTLKIRGINDGRKQHKEDPGLWFM
jgi:hypothetical protein